jgi:HSP90 family molecular chaperone
MIHDSTHRSKLIELLRFSTSKTDRKISLKEYLNRMVDGQDDIYFIAGDDIKLLKSNPNLQILKRKDYEVLMFDRPLDEFAFQEIKDYESKKIVNINKGLVLKETDLEKKK